MAKLRLNEVTQQLESVEAALEDAQAQLQEQAALVVRLEEDLLAAEQPNGRLDEDGFPTALIGDRS